MKCKILFLAIAIGISHALIAQVPQILNEIKPKKPFEGIPALVKGNSIVSFGYGFPNNMATFLSLGGIGGFLSESSTKSGFGPLFASYEYMVRPDKGLGLSVSYANATKNYKGLIGVGDVTGKISGFSILGSYIQHLYITDKWDPYLKGSIGLNIWEGSYKTADDTEFQSFTAPTPIGYQAMIGARYFASKNVAPYAELSYSILKFTGNVGIAFKLGKQN